MKSTSIFFAGFMESQQSQYSGDKVVAVHDKQTSGLGSVRAQIPVVRGKGWQGSGWTPEDLLALSKNPKFSAKARETLERLASQSLESLPDAQKIAMADARLTAKELEGLMRDFAAERPKVAKNAQLIGQTEYIRDGWELDHAFMDWVKAQIDAIASASAEVLRTGTA